MSMTQPPEERVAGGLTQMGGPAQVRGEATDSFSTTPWTKLRETKPSYLTTELWLTIAGVAALIITYNVKDEPTLDLWRMCLLATILGAAYVVSRGLAKSQSQDQQHIPQHLRRDTGDRYVEARHPETRSEQPIS